MLTKTIYALSTVYGKSGVAVIRISGDKALEVIQKLTKLDVKKIEQRRAYFTTLFNFQKKEPLDRALVLYFKAPYSFTGEDIVEIQCHGSKAVLRSVLDLLADLEGFRLAEPGEFSKRAFYHQKMDLTEAEGLADLIDAETSEQQKYALKQMSGNLKNLYSSWRERLLDIEAYLEAYIDFPDEDIPENIKQEKMNSVFRLIDEIEEHLSKGKAGERLRDGFRVVISGPTNAGKSSLVNAIVERNAVIVSDIAGTTRDAVDVYLNIKGYPVILTDTAGLRSSDDVIEQKGIEIAKDKINEADLVLALFDGTLDAQNVFDGYSNEIKDKIIFVANKADLLDAERCSKFKKSGCLLLSAKTKAGLSDLYDEIEKRISKKLATPTGTIITRARYREALKECLQNLKNFHFEKEIELAAEDIRLSARALGKITGQIEVNEILDKIFGSFCIGK